MEHARKPYWEGAGETRALDRDEGPEDSLTGLNKILRLALAPKDRPPLGERDEGGAIGQRYSATLDLVTEFSDALRMAQQQAEETEARAQSFMARATQELRAAEGAVRTSQARAQEAEARAAAAEARADQAEEWLARIHEALEQQLGAARPQPPYGANAAGEIPPQTAQEKPVGPAL